MEKKMETAIVFWGYIGSPCRPPTPDPPKPKALHSYRGQGHGDALALAPRARPARCHQAWPNMQSWRCRGLGVRGLGFRLGV